MSNRIVDHATARRAALVAAIWVPLAVVVLSEAVIIAVGASKGSDLIVHWGAEGDRTGPWWTYAVLVAAIGFPVIAFIGYFIARATRMVGMNTWMPAVAVGITVFHAIGMGVGSVLLNSSPLAPLLPLAGGFVLAVAAALVTWWLLPREAPTTHEVEAAGSLPLKPGEIAAWSAKVDLPGWFVALISGVAGLLIVLGVFLLVTTSGAVWWIFLSPALLLVVLAGTAQFAVSAGPRGFVVRSALGWPRIAIPAASIAKVGVVHVDPMADFGGWGIRWIMGPSRKGRWGVVTRRGSGLEVVRDDGRSVVVTVDDAGTAAAVLETYALRRS
jgi:hypothetical protein